MAKKPSLFDDLFAIARKLPWWLSLAIALGSGVYLHSVANGPVPVAANPQDLQSVVFGSAIRAAAGIGQYVLPLIFGIGAIASIVGRRKRRALLRSAGGPAGNAQLIMSWHDFELLVGEALRRRGYAVQETGAKGPDGGVDLIARKEGETYLVQCKHWRAAQVGVPVVRELYGAMAAEGAVGGFVVTSGTFTQPARDFASGRNLQLVDGALLKRWIAEAKKPGPQPSVETLDERVEPAMAEQASRNTRTTGPTGTHESATPDAEAAPLPASPKAPACPFCRKTMVIRVARSGANAGGNFWGCAAYPKCRGIRPIFAPMKMG